VLPAQKNDKIKSSKDMININNPAAINAGASKGRVIFTKV
jgi:hypothetical protein